MVVKVVLCTLFEVHLLRGLTGILLCTIWILVPLSRIFDLHSLNT
jgi:hypothetical protein